MIARLPRYYRYLGELMEDGVERISSSELSARMKVTASQIRQDLNNFGGFGQQGYGYNVKYLYTEIAKILGIDRQHNLIIIGAGNLGQAIANYANFERRGFIIKGMFDVNPRLIGLVVRGIEIRGVEELEKFIVENDVQIAALTIPKTKAPEIADRLVKAGIKAIWNFAHTDLQVPDDVVENIGIERTFQKMEEAKIVIWLLDEQPSASEIEEMKLKNQGKKLLVVFNKMDKLENDKLAFDKFTHSCGSDSSESEAPLFISARTGENVSSLEQALVKAADIPEITENDVIITSARHYEALLRAHDSLSRVLESMEMGMSGDIVAEDLKMVLEELGEITGGQISSQETLNNIFKHFCIGK